jgi:hypothetical protein
MSTVEPMVLRDCKSLIVPRPRLHPWWSGLGANGRAMLAAAGTVQVSRRAQTCSLSHFAMKLFFAAPASGLPSDPIALGSHASPHEAVFRSAGERLLHLHKIQGNTGGETLAGKLDRSISGWTKCRCALYVRGWSARPVA